MKAPNICLEAAVDIGASARRCPTLADEPPASRLGMKAQASAACVARHHLVRALREWDRRDLADPAELLVSELVTNAIKASCRSGANLPGEQPDSQRVIALTLWRTEVGIVIEVWDPSAMPPVLSEQDPLNEGGRGLFLVDVLAVRWGYHAAEGGGKVVWCEIGATAGQ